MEFDPAGQRAGIGEDRQEHTLQQRPDGTSGGTGIDQPASWTKLLCWSAVGVALLSFLAALYASRHWPLFHDAAIMHYVVFLMEHGMQPYRDIVDINMPGAYMMEWLAMHVFGSGSVGWRLFDIATMLAAIGSMTLIPAPEDRLAGLLGGLAVCLFHLANGPIEVGQRDWVMMVFVVLSIACLQAALRGGRPWLMFCFAVLAGCAATIKPLAIPAPFAMLLFACVVLRGKGVGLRAYLLAAFLGACVPTVVIVIFFARTGSFSAFVQIAGSMTRLYAAGGDLPLFYMVRTVLGALLDLLVLASLYVAIVTRAWRNWQMVTVLLGICIGAFLYFGQRKGWQYHKGTLFAFVLLWVCVQLFRGLRRSDHLRWVGAAGIVVLCFLLVHTWMLPTFHYRYGRPAVEPLEADLAQIGGADLSGNIQCMESVSGCINALYDMRLVQSTGFFFDSFWYTQTPAPEIRQLRDQFFAQLRQRPPQVMVVMSMATKNYTWDYDRIDAWPAFKQFLVTDYALRKEQDGPGGVIGLGSYRLYVHQ